MHDPGLVRPRQGLQRLQADPRDPGRVQPSFPPDHPGQGGAVDELHHDGRGPSGGDHRKDGDDPGVVQPGRRLNLPGYPVSQFLAPGGVQVVREHDLLDRDGTFHHRVVAPPHPAQAARADQLDKPVPPIEDVFARLFHSSARYRQDHEKALYLFF
ncbi:hypothetical protein GCM10010517_34530 [Streptosporangium fragile]|uniref:Uncharacterized protein n=1 Tax=Streptosporangium fragile TaxID=46186 RepID=A0ABP6IDW5_9ACTN